MKRNFISLVLVALFILTTTMTTTYAVNANQMFDPKQTNELFDGLVSGAASKEELQGIDYDDTTLWAINGWSRAWLITSLFADLKDNDSQMYNQFASTASQFYVALVPPMFDDKYIYYILAIDEKDALNFTYTPGSTACSYGVIPNITQQNIDNLSLLAVNVWEVTETDFNELNKIIDNEKDDEKSNGSILIIGIIAALSILGVVLLKKKRSINAIGNSDVVPAIQNNATSQSDSTMEKGENEKQL